MDTLTKRTTATRRGFTYTYYFVPARDGKPTLLLQHGFPDTAATWEDLILNHLKPAGYGVIAPDMLGYGGTSKPTDPAQYKYSGLADDLADLLDAEDIPQAISLGHDWGSFAAQALHNHHPERVSGLAMIVVPYSPTATAPFDLDAANAATEKLFGRGMLWYWKFFTSPDGPALLRERADVAFDAFHAPQSWPDLLCTEGGLRRALEGRGDGVDLSRRPYATDDMKKEWVERLTRDGFEAPCCWYGATVFGHQNGDGKSENDRVEVPSLYVGYSGDFLSRPELADRQVQSGFLPHLTSVTLQGPHWGFLEDPKTFGETILGWLSKEF